jgi:class 3 adenylate cyclase
MGEGVDEKQKTRRSLRAVFAADITGFSGVMSANETGAIGTLNEIRAIAIQQLQAHDGWLFGMPGDGIFALFESAVNAVRCALETQHQLALRGETQDMRLRIGVHLGDVLFEKDLPYGEALTIAARLEDLADPGGILISGAVMDAVSARISATFEERGVPRLKNIPRRIVTFAVKPPPERNKGDETRVGLSILDRTTQFDVETLRRIRDEQFSALSEDRTLQTSSDAIVLDKRPSVQPDEVNGNVMPAARKASSPAVDPAGAQTPPGSDAVKTRVAPPPAAQRPDDTRQEPPERQPTTPPIPSESVVAASKAEAELGLLAEPPGQRPSDECIESLIAALAVHLGPFAKVLVNRMLKKASSTEHLVSLLEEQIESNEERFLFRIRALHICMTFANHQSDES